MTAFKPAATTALLCSVAFASPVWADVTAEQVWENWKGTMGIYGGGLTIGSETVSGGTVSVSDISIKIEDGRESVEATISSVELTENGDGTVTITMSEENPLTFTSYDTVLPITIRSENLQMVVSGTPEEMNYAMTADRYGLEATPGTYDDVNIRAGAFYMNAVEGTYTTVTGDMQDLDYTMSMGSITMDLEIREPGGSGAVVFKGMIDGLTAVVDATIPADIATMENPDAVFVEGLTMDASYEFGASTYEFNMNVDGDVGQGSASAAGGAMAIAMSKDGFSYTGGAQQPQVSMFGFDIPFPVEIAMEEYSYNLEVPLSKSDTPRDAALAVALRGVTVNDILWSLIDPALVLPRDPATVAIDLSGTAKPLFDFLDPAQQMEAAMSDMPFEPESVTLNSLEISAAGAEVTGNGAFTFDMSDMTTFPGMPRPTGQLNLAINGANGLIDKLIQMGLLPEEQAMGARMMMGMFASPVGDDMLESVIEINDQGHVIANGQRLQ